MKLTNEQLSKIAELAGWKKGSLGLWDDGMKLHTLIELNSLDLLFGILNSKVQFKISIFKTHENKWQVCIENLGTPLIDICEVEDSLVEALQISILKYVENKAT